MLDEESRIQLPPVPAAQADLPVAAWREPVTIDTYAPMAPDRYPAYLDRRVYQGSSGRIYPLPFHERIEPDKAPRSWDAVHIQNRWVRLMVLPELGGRIHIGVDLTNGYDFFYRNNVIKPALVGLAGPWISGGVEFNWPQHHRPATFLATEVEIEHEPDGCITVWCSDHDPFARMKGMHGVRLRPDSAVVELRARLFNRSEDVQTFLWWANVAARVGDDYQSFFPTDVTMVADHAKRAVTGFPNADRPYYGVDYPARVDADHPDGDRLDWYRNIPVPTSYMAIGSEDDFFGGYDHGAGAGFVHWADHHVSPGKKQWTWGNAEFGWAWDRNLTDGDGPYVELMAGVFTDNQPDFTFLAPGETKAFSQYWYPIQRTGPVHQATLDAAVRLDVDHLGSATRAHVAVAVTAPRPDLTVALLVDGSVVWTARRDAAPDAPVLETVELGARYEPHQLTVEVRSGDDLLVAWQPRRPGASAPALTPAAEPTAPELVATTEELYLVGRHLEQYRHATRSPEPYWREALRRDPEDVRCNVALAARLHRDAQYAQALGHLETALARLTRLNPNPETGEAHYRLGATLARLGRDRDARTAYGKAGWDNAWTVPAGLSLARLEAAEGEPGALDRVLDLLAREPQHLQVRDLAVVLLRRSGDADRADAVLAATLELDPLDQWARHLRDGSLSSDPTTCLDVALEYATVGEWAAALDVLETTAARPTPVGQVNVAPLAHYHRADLLARAGQEAAAAEAYAAAHAADRTYCLASRLDDVDMLERTVQRDPQDALAWALIGHWRYAHDRHADAMTAWRRSLDAGAEDPVVWRNLAVGMVNVEDDPDGARHCYRVARELAPGDARLLYETDQLARRQGESTGVRLAALQAAGSLVEDRDDLVVELARLRTANGDAERAATILGSRVFQPWEGGEGQVLGAWDEACLARARAALAGGDAASALAAVEEALVPPLTLGEGRHLLANNSHLLLALGDARAASGDLDGAREAWSRAAAFSGDFQEMATTPYSEMTYYSVLAARRAGDDATADRLVAGLAEHVARLADTPATIDYFATSLPTLLLFTEDLDARRAITVLVLRAQLGDLTAETATDELLDEALRRDPGHLRALDLRRLRDAARTTPEPGREAAPVPVPATTSPGDRQYGEE
ncbi:DUF5107 domain-containing protein [Actinotalea sp. M2MS4P-6]|uniref:DUF5107 domain-containing protein n=1 Tax=Actinotalea sp. M2MS4P-6 TaxID=2983762 RepID=UPI0021E3F285|nr:DUF5107 domain-containing protein [Actinotalea sp. M2MS4P-6]MCV2395898.1 DUF5107 domain-containing protein [Actinotalea sp. M2MS4P-6]